jgi:hypothetical protein
MARTQVQTEDHLRVTVRIAADDPNHTAAAGGGADARGDQRAKTVSFVPITEKSSTAVCRFLLRAAVSADAGGAPPPASRPLGGPHAV